MTYTYFFGWDNFTPMKAVKKECKEKISKQTGNS